ncbi:VOC family protein [Paraferrimonas sp. SM1919]|uniref:VOC family protein n=1 Tax=Paraferrimonas sp. SM1919 TaxID=2662263 RepID=UPI0013D610CA|nr:hypothetical protein [Paraferrimonas sp. SM1919]
MAANLGRLGEFTGAVLASNNIEMQAHSYIHALGFKVSKRSLVCEKQADNWQASGLLGSPRIDLMAPDGSSWLTLVQEQHLVRANPLQTHGWMALEINVANVDKLRQSCIGAGFEIIGEPAYLQLSDSIKAMQIKGHGGEISYLTQIDNEVPPFKLPQTDALSAGLFITVLNCADRAESLAFYESLNQGQAGLKFDTKVTVLNKAWGKATENQYPVATLQLNGKALFEIDEVVGSDINPASDSLPAGIGLIRIETFALDDIAKEQGVEIYQADYGRAALIIGPSGERLELIEGS